MDDLIEALTILRKYGNPDYPTACSDAMLTICGIDPATVSAEDKDRLSELGIFVSNEFGEDEFHSFRFGSA